MEIKTLLEENKFPIVSHDRPISLECSKKRPDFIIQSECGFLIVLEVDEYQHDRYECACEQTRMLQIFQDAGGVPLVFIRYNPDRFKTNNEVKNPSGPTRHQTLLRLLGQLRSRTEYPPGNTDNKAAICVYYLFYDGQAKTGANWEPERFVLLDMD